MHQQRLYSRQEKTLWHSHLIMQNCSLYCPAHEHIPYQHSLDCSLLKSSSIILQYLMLLCICKYMPGAASQDLHIVPSLHASSCRLAVVVAEMRHSCISLSCYLHAQTGHQRAAGAKYMVQSKDRAITE